MKILIAGDGKVGLMLTSKLSKEGHELTVIDSKKGVLESSLERYDVMTVQGNCASMEALKEAQVEEMDLLIAATSADEINLLCCLTAHGINPDLHTIARVRNPEYIDQVYSMRDTFALSMMVNPDKQAALEIERLLKYPGFLRRDTFTRGRVELVELRVDPDNILCKAKLSELYNIVKCQVLVCAVRRGGKVITPSGDFVLEAGDRIFVTGQPSELTVLLKNLGIITHKAKRVILAGGGRVTYYLAQAMAKTGVMVQIIEKDYERCLALSEMLPGCSIINGDAGDQALLEQEGIRDADALVTLTGLDELNMIVSMYGQSCGVPQIVTKVSRIENNQILDSLPLGSVICPKELCSNTIVRYVRAMQNQTGAATAVHTLADGKAEAMEFKVEDQTNHCGVPLKNLRIRKNVRIAAILHGKETEIPDGNSRFDQGDHIIVVSGEDVVIRQINDIFES